MEKLSAFKIFQQYLGWMPSAFKGFQASAELKQLLGELQRLSAPTKGHDTTQSLEESKRELEEDLRCCQAAVIHWLKSIHRFEALQQSMATQSSSMPVSLCVSFSSPSSWASPAFVADCIDSDDVACLLMNPSSRLWTMLHSNVPDEGRLLLADSCFKVR